MTTGQKTGARNSSIELLRLLCIFGILMMHAFAGIDTASSPLNTAGHVLVNSLFNTGVTCFILISGYFGIRFSLEKLVQLDLMVIFFSVSGTLLTEGFALKTLIKAALPVLTRQYWFITCYFALCILAPFLNLAAEKITKEWFEKLLLVLLFLFSLVPTFGLYDIMQDAGKGLVHFVMIYLLGRYLALYGKKTYKKSRLIFGLLFSVGVVFGADVILSFQKHTIYTTFSRDCSIFIIFASVLLLLLFLQKSFCVSAINRIAGDVLAVYILDGFVRAFFDRYISLNDYADHPALLFIVVLYVLAVMGTAIALNELRRVTLGRLEPWLAGWITGIIHRLGGLLLRLFQLLKKSL